MLKALIQEVKCEVFEELKSELKEMLLAELKSELMGSLAQEAVGEYEVIEKEEEVKKPTRKSKKDKSEKGCTKVNIVNNKEQGGLELHFDGKPSKEVLDSLKTNGFRWHKVKGVWYKKNKKGVFKECQRIKNHVENGFVL